MNDLFRFLIIRGPEEPAADAAINLSMDSSLGAQLTHARTETDPRAAMTQVAKHYLQSDQAVTSVGSLATGEQLTRFVAALTPTDTPDKVARLAEQHFGQSVQQLAQSSELAADQRRLADTLLALPLTGGANGSGAATTTSTPVVDLYRGIEVIQAAAAADNGQGVSNPAEIIRRPVVLPGHLFPLPTTQEQQIPPTPDPKGDATQKEQAELAQQAMALASALHALSEVPVTEADTMTLSSGSASPVANAQELMSEKATTRVSRLPSQPIASDASLISARVGQLFSPIVGGRPVIEQLPIDTQHIVMSFGAEVRNLPIVPLTNVIRAKFTDVLKKINHDSIIWWKPTTTPAQHDEATDPPPAVMTNPPASHGSVQPAGVADLLVVRQHVLRYEPGEVAYIESVAIGEDFQRTTKRRQSTQSTVIVDLTTSTTQERDTQATSRFDLNNQTNSVLQSDYARVPGSPNSETYGALVQSGGSKQDASNTATNHSQDITSRAASQIAQQYSTQTITQTANSFEEDINHHFDNSKGTKEEITVYQWLDKICQAQVFSYGKRVMYDINVPEPADFLLRALAHKQPDIMTMQRPLSLTISPDELDELSYLYYGSHYGATGLQTPPDHYHVVSTQWDVPPTGGNQPTVNTTRSATITIPEGYSASKAVINCLYVYWEGSGDPGFSMTVGQHQLHVGGKDGPKQTANLDGEIGTIPVAVVVDGPVYDCTITVEVVCARTPEAYETWQLRTYDTILQASRDRISEYESKMAMLQASLKLLTFGQGEHRKRQLERSELQKAALAVLTNQQFDSLNAVEHSAQGYPQPFLPNVEGVGRYVRFLEQAFEWDQMTYLFYPYFWGRKPYWIDRVMTEDSDDEFGDFLRAGSARVMVPVRPGFEGVVGTFMTTGNVPTMQQLGQLTSAQYLPYLAEVQGETGGPDTAVPYGPPWEVRLPTTLTAARKDASLPRWKEQTDAHGNAVWVTDGADVLV